MEVLLYSVCLYTQEHGFVADMGIKRLQCEEFFWLGTEQWWLAWTSRATVGWASNQLCVLGLALLWILSRRPEPFSPGPSSCLHPEGPLLLFFNHSRQH